MTNPTPTSTEEQPTKNPTPIDNQTANHSTQNSEYPTETGKLSPPEPGAARRGQGSSGEQPPTSNTGALIQSRSGIDWLEFTIKTPAPVDKDYYYQKYAKLLHGGMETDRNMFGYNRVSMVLGSGFIMWSSEYPQMGLHISMPAQALRVWEELNPETSVYGLLIEARGDDATFTRIDIAFDTPEVHIDTFIDAIEGGELVTKAQTVRCEGEMRGKPGATVYIGSKRSDRVVRIYDKAAERNVPGVWTRIETQYRKKYADQVVDAILLSDVSLEVLSATAFDFREVGATRSNNRKRSSWWTALLGDFEKITFTLKKGLTTLEEKAAWLEKAIMPTLAAVFLKFGVAWFEAALDEGVKRISPVNRALLYQT